MYMFCLNRVGKLVEMFYILYYFINLFEIIVLVIIFLIKGIIIFEYLKIFCYFIVNWMYFILYKSKNK